MSADTNTKVFPREDNMYKKKESLPYDEAKSLVWKRSEHTSNVSNTRG